MKRTVVYHTLWLLSERDESARKISFSSTHNLLAGENETGKSRILKHLVWALGCEPTARDAGNWDSNIVASVDLSIDGTRYTFLRRGNHQRAAFDANGTLLISTENASTWASFFADRFAFHLKLQRHQEGTFALAGPEYALLPFYIDQEGGWSRKWNNFKRLTQFARWEIPVFESFAGLRPQRYFEAQLTRDELAYQLKEAHAQAKVQAKAYEEVKAMLPTTDAKLDEALFAQELREMSSKVTELGREEDKVRTELFDVTQQLQERTAELQMVTRAEQDLVADLVYLAKVPDDGKLACPTCGQEHGVTFRARLDLASDAKDAHHLVLKVRDQLDKLRNREAKLRVQLKNVATQMEQLRSVMERHKEEGSVADIVIAKSLDTIALAYNKARRDLKERIDELDENKQELQDELSTLTDNIRLKEVRKSFKETIKAHADRLGIAAAEIKGIKIGSRPAMASGSSGPRIYLAMHLALLEINAQYGSGPRFPFIVDTPRQQGLDDKNTAKLLNAIYGHSTAHQIFVANESVPDSWLGRDQCHIIYFDDKRKVLRESDYRESLEILAPQVQAMQEAIHIERERTAATEEDSSTNEDDTDTDTDVEDEDEE
ncbi:ATP-binding protein [Chromobacterium sp. IRSSSOUMB001]|uniref:ATP-binding protein n=1 Tax=Chromobacterium sp. IRSSSOUMB001 TaxID=2927123 RepID=UPI0020BFA654|nr:ATP-binding protein [Chromobacterium sp. IRSSSOUMB001]